MEKGVGRRPMRGVHGARVTRGGRRVEKETHKLVGVGWIIVSTVETVGLTQGLLAYHTSAAVSRPYWPLVRLLDYEGNRRCFQSRQLVNLKPKKK